MLVPRGEEERRVLTHARTLTHNYREDFATNNVTLFVNVKNK